MTEEHRLLNDAVDAAESVRRELDAAQERIALLEQEGADLQREVDAQLGAKRSAEDRLEIEQGWKQRYLDERDRAREQVKRMQPVVDAARAIAEAEGRGEPSVADESAALIAAVQAYDAWLDGE